MPGLVPGIHDFEVRENVDGRDEPGHDDACVRGERLRPYWVNLASAPWQSGVSDARLLKRQRRMRPSPRSMSAQ